MQALAVAKRMRRSVEIKAIERREVMREVEGLRAQLDEALQNKAMAVPMLEDAQASCDTAVSRASRNGCRYIPTAFDHPPNVSPLVLSCEFCCSSSLRRCISQIRR